MQEPSCNSTQSQASAIAYMLIGSALIGIGPFFVEFSTVSAETNTFYRLLFGGVCFTLISLVRKEFRLSSAFATTCFLAGTFLVLDLFLWNRSVLYIGAGLSTVLSNLEVVFLVLIGKLFYGEESPKGFWKLCFFIFLGVYLLLCPVLPGLSLDNVYGITFALSASLSYALYLFAIKYIGNKFPEYPSTSMLAMTCLTGCVLLGAIIGSSRPESFVLPSWHSVSCLVLNSLLSQVAGWWFISKGIKQLSLSLAGVLLLLQPALTYVLDGLFMARHTEWIQLVGCCCLLVSIFFATHYQKLHQEETAHA